LFKRRSAVSIVGGSPGLKILNTSNSASSLDLALSSCNVFLMDALISTLSIFNICIFDNFRSFMRDIKSSSISYPAS